MKELTASERRLAHEMTLSTFRDDMLELIEKHGGRTRYIHRSPTGFPKVMAVGFGPRTFPTFELEIQDKGRPEDPLAKDERERFGREKAQEKRYNETQKLIKDALAKQRRELLKETCVGQVPSTDVAGDGAPKGSVERPERWSKRSFTEYLTDALEKGEVLMDAIGQDGSNVILVTSGDQEFKITVSMPRKS